MNVSARQMEANALSQIVRIHF